VADLADVNRRGTVLKVFARRGNAESDQMGVQSFSRGGLNELVSNQIYGGAIPGTPEQRGSNVSRRKGEQPRSPE